MEITMGNGNRLKNGLDMLYLAACALHDEIPDKKRISSMDIEGVMSEASRHSMNGVTYLGIRKYLDNTPNADIGVDADTLIKWKNLYARLIKKTILFDLERF